MNKNSKKTKNTDNNKKKNNRLNYMIICYKSHGNVRPLNWDNDLLMLDTRRKHQREREKEREREKKKEKKERKNADIENTTQEQGRGI